MDIEILYHDKFKFEQEEYLFKMYLNRIRKISVSYTQSDAADE